MSATNPTRPLFGCADSVVSEELRQEGVLIRPIEHDSYVAGIDDELRAELIRNALQDRQAQLVSWREEPMGGGGSGSELYTVSGEATSRGTVRPWKFILKMFNHEGEGWQESSTDPMAWDYWKREWLVYQAPCIDDLREGTGRATLLRIRRVGRERRLGGYRGSRRSRPATMVTEPLRGGCATSRRVQW